MRQSDHPSTAFYIYLIAFHAAWVGYVVRIYPWMQSLGSRSLLYALTNLAIRILVWILPVFVFLRYIDHVDPMEYLKLKQDWKRGLLIGVVLSIANFLGSMLRFGAPHPSADSITWNSVLSTSLLIGFIEEIPYRGFILQKFETQYGFWTANLLSSLLFFSIHLPGWISLHLLSTGGALFVFLLGVVLAMVFKYGRSLWGSIITHSLNDFLAAVLFPH